MKTNEILEGNKLIAEFMGWGERGIYRTPFEDAGMCNGEPSSICYDRNLLFNSDWNWLMLVVEKIEEIEDKNGYNIFWVKIDGVCCEIQQADSLDIIVEADCETKIESVFLACVKFIKWYNQNK